MKIAIHNLNFSYNGSRVLENVSNCIEKGDFVTLVGPNGSGKSTLIKCMAGILKTKNGTVRIENRKIESVLPADLAKQMAYVPQSEHRTPVFTVFDQVLLGRKPYFNWRPGKRDLAVTSRVLRDLRLEHIAMNDVHRLSGGQRQAVIIARALAQEPDILLLDEPTSNLDMKHQIEILEILKSLAQNGVTIIIALHDINMAIRYANRIIMLKRGRVFTAGGREIITVENLENLYEVKVSIVKQGEHQFVIPCGHRNETEK
ncbi:MAG: ABC transporter ATP-binding protein [Cytophagales bacterium]|nr:ABC transporter ATP-binding protein [Cytophagales bacterium]